MKLSMRITGLLLSLTLAAGLCPVTVPAAGSTEVRSEEVGNTAIETAGSECKTEEQNMGLEDPASTEVEAADDTALLPADTILAESLLAALPEETDETDPQVIRLRSELEEMQVLAETVGEQSADAEACASLTDDQIETLLGLYQIYVKQAVLNADVLGVTTPFFLQYNDAEDELGIFGEMLIVAGYEVGDVRSGNFTYDNLVGMLLNFYYGDFFGVSDGIDYLTYNMSVSDENSEEEQNEVSTPAVGGFFRDEILAGRNAALQAVEDAGCQTEAQKLLVLNDYLASVDSMDMAYILNQGTADMTAEEPDETQGLGEEKYQSMIDTLYLFYESAVREEVEAQLLPLVKAEVRSQVYDQTYWEAIDAFSGEEAAAAQAEEAAEAYMALAEEAGGIPGTGTADAAGTEAVESRGETESTGETESRGETESTETSESTTDLDTIISWQSLLDEAMAATPLESYGGMTGDELVVYTASQAVDVLMERIFAYWETTTVGALAQGKSVCLGYARTYAYLVQCLHPEIYTNSGNLDDAEDWKTAEDLYTDAEGKLDVNDRMQEENGYCVDCVRIQFSATVSMFGTARTNYNTEHYWNAVKVDGIWYYIDTNYTDAYHEIMVRDQTEVDGAMTHMYFLTSDTSIRDMFKGSYSEIRTFYQEAATDTRYENSWMAKAASAVTSDGTYFYYMYNSRNLREVLKLLSHMRTDYGSSLNGLKVMEDAEFCVVRHKITEDDCPVSAEELEASVNANGSGADTDFDILIKLGEQEASDSGGKVEAYNPVTDTYEENPVLSEALAAYQEMAEIYPAAQLTAAYYEGKVYFNLANAVFSYELATGGICCIRQYGTVYAERDKSQAWGANAFAMTDEASGDTLSVANAPVAGIAINSLGRLTVSLATNYSLVSGKAALEDSSSKGYEYQESAYDSGYSLYSTDVSAAKAAAWLEGYAVKDNDEFLWSAVFTETIDVGLLSEVTYEVPSCDHTYILYRQNYYTKDSYENFREGASWVCTGCGKHIETAHMTDEEREEVKEQSIYEIADGSWENGIFTFTKLTAQESAVPDGYDYSQEKELVTEITLDEPVVAEACAEYLLGSCEQGGLVRYTASGYTSEGYYYSASTVESVEAGHLFRGEWTFEDGEASIAADSLICIGCGQTAETLADGGEITLSVDTGRCMVRDASCTQSGAEYRVASGSVLCRRTEEEEDLAADGVATLGTILPSCEAVYTSPEGHQWTASGWNWTTEEGELYGTICTTDVTGAVLTIQCSICGKTEDRPAELTAIAAEDADCETAQTVTYQASVTVPVSRSASCQETVTRVWPLGLPLGHMVSEVLAWDVVYAGVQHKDILPTARLTRVCTRCGCILSEEQVDSTIYREDDSITDAPAASDEVFDGTRIYAAEAGGQRISMTAGILATGLLIHYSYGSKTYDQFIRSNQRSAALAAAAFTRTGYHLKCWKDEEGETYTDGEDVTGLLPAAGENREELNLKAVWSRNTFTISFKANLSGAAGKMSKLAVTYGKSAKLPKAAYKKKGYSFLGWRVYSSVRKKWLAVNKKGSRVWATKAVINKKGYSFVTLANKANVKTLTGKHKDKLILYAKWKKG